MVSACTNYKKRFDETSRPHALTAIHLMVPYKLVTGDTKEMIYNRQYLLANFLASIEMLLGRSVS